LRIRDGSDVVTPEERLDWIDRLQREAAEGRARVEERRRQREENPLDYLEAADARLTQDPSDLHFTAPTEPLEGQGSAYTRRGNGAGNALQPAPAPSSADEAGDWRDAVAEGIGLACEELRREFERELAVLKNENAEIRGMLGAALTMLGKSDTVSHSKSADVHHLPRGFLRRVHNG
jgi:hypothetical protein